MEKIRQQLQSERGELNRYNSQLNQYQQDRTFRNNECSIKY